MVTLLSILIANALHYDSMSIDNTFASCAICTPSNQISRLVFKKNASQTENIVISAKGKSLT